jgi:hypothetical protein
MVADSGGGGETKVLVVVVVVGVGSVVGKQIEAVARQCPLHEPVGTWLPISGSYSWTGSSAVKRVLLWHLLEVEGSNLIGRITFWVQLC